MIDSAAARRVRGMHLATGTSVVALLLGWAMPASAQTATPVPTASEQSGTVAPSAEEGVAGAQAEGTTPAQDQADIVVTGVRASLQSAQNIKRNSAQIVDSIVAEDIGKLPDRNIAEALQRISGIQIQRNYGEGSSVAIRGLTQVRTELNGRDIFTASANSSSLSLEDVPSELLAGIDVYKNPSADLIEDQLSGTINFRTRKPFDFNGFKVSAAATNTYYDLARKSQPTASLLVSNRWNTGIGEFGLLVSASYQKTVFSQDTISTEPFETLDPNDPDPIIRAASLAALSSLGRTGQVTTIPHGTGIGQVNGARRRFGIDASLQWRPTDTLEITGELFRNDYKFRYDDFSYFAEPAEGALNVVPIPGAAFAFGPNGDFQSGSFRDIRLAANTSLEKRHSTTTDYSLNAKWRPSASLTITADGQFVDSKTNGLRSIVGLNGVGNATLIQDISGDIPSFQITAPGGLENPANYASAFYLDNLSNSRGKDKTGRLDAEYKLDGGVLQSIKVGARYADRSSRSSDTGYRYTGLNAVPAQLEFGNFSKFFRGDADLFGNALLFSRGITRDYGTTLGTLGIPTTPSYLPSSTSNQSQKTYTGYATAFFKADTLPVPIDGNIGVRVVRTKLNVDGFYQQTDLVTPVAGGPQVTGPTTFVPIVSSDNYTSVLPSLNLRAHLTEKMQLRLALSKNISRPTLSQLNPSLNITEPGIAQIRQEQYTSGGNPDLKPMTSKNLDASAEWYFSRTGSLTVAGFYKDISDYIQTGISQRNVTFTDGQTALYNVTSYSNVSNAKVKGAEVAYQQFYDFLPGPLAGLGAQANFTFVDSSAPSPATEGPVRQLPLQGLSKYNYNLIGIYERGIISARVAYNWRSKYLRLTSGNGSGNLPVFQKASGQFDASITANVTPHLSLTLNGVNLLNTIQQTYYGLESRPRDSIANDRQISGVARITF
ncbi:TonB-dependent receptor [Sphingomonas sp. CFBP 13733]|uniref:TonB-dependent receptor n=1 Tax=Sphingomonas sp. CFBP 13733 TaxID=2775291 RepID=UPI001FD0A081|nr:TonB-dependent receptor [Sphingomonas sp. CFBP 13733]